MGLLKGIFGKKKREQESVDLTGPLRLSPGDRIAYYQDELVVRGVLLLEIGVEHRYQYRLEDEAEDRWILSVATKGELTLVLERPAKRADIEYEGGESLTLRGEAFGLVERGSATVTGVGEVPQAGTVVFQTFHDEEDERTVVFERWGSVTEARTGEYVQEGEISVVRRIEDSFDLKAPTRIDLRALNRERQKRQKASEGPTEEEKTLALEEARRKLAALKDGAAESSQA